MPSVYWRMAGTTMSRVAAKQITSRVSKVRMSCVAAAQTGTRRRRVSGRGAIEKSADRLNQPVAIDRFHQLQIVGADSVTVDRCFLRIT